jgi:hypothetical protein
VAKEVDMFCINCGTELPDEANFCLRCGKPQEEGVKVEEPRWETCEILHTTLNAPWFGDYEKQFWAAAIGPQGKYNAGESPVFESLYTSPSGSSQEAIDAHDALIKTLLEDGWEPIGDRRYWWGDRFRRRVR